MTTRPVAAGQLSRDNLTERIFRALYQEFDLRTVNDTHVVVPKGTPWFAGTSLGDIARQISDHDHPGPAPQLPRPGPGRAPLPRHHPSSAAPKLTGLHPRPLLRVNCHEQAIAIVLSRSAQLTTSQSATHSPRCSSSVIRSGVCMPLRVPPDGCQRPNLPN
jgi:hypothetical protein